ncbi:hypothetical protein DMP14_19405 [Pseudonocardia sp. Ae707_Ps2]|nr:hypothetical protein XF36_03880 [Pseudonocardia sp. HH130629-09]
MPSIRCIRIEGLARLVVVRPLRPGRPSQDEADQYVERSVGSYSPSRTRRRYLIDPERLDT